MSHARNARSRMNLRYLKTFVDIAEPGSIARAGTRLTVSQSAASRQILELEGELGVRLFDRIGRRVGKACGGGGLLQHCRRNLMEADLLSARARALKWGQTGILRVGATPMVIENTLSGFLKQYQARHPGVEVHFVEDGGLRLPNRLEQGEVHLALVVPYDRFGNRLLFPVLNVAVLPIKHRLARRRALDVAELAEEPFLLLHRTFGSREWFESACNVAHIRPRVLLESAAPHTLIALANVGYGIAVVPSTVVLSAGVRAVPLVQRGTPIGKWFSIAWDPQRVLAAYAEQFVNELAVYCRRDYPGRDFIRRAPPLPRPRSLAN